VTFAPPQSGGASKQSRASRRPYDKTAVVTYDDAKADMKGLIEATTKIGYPSKPKE
jgi:hypothetical protein